MRTLPINQKAYVTLDADGNGTASCGPLSPGEIWETPTVHVSVATNVNEAICQAYAGAAATPGYFASSTTWGSTGDTCGGLPSVRVGSNVFAVWTGGDPGSLATMSVSGTRLVR